MTSLPFDPAHVGVPPIKCQGIKTKLVPFVCRSVKWSSEQGRWIEPFVGSAVVVLNVAPERALLADTNEHIVRFYQAIQKAEISASSARAHLVTEGRILERLGADHYYQVRERFNESASPLDFLFLNRSCFNGVMRFNREGRFNVPFGHKPLRFSRAYVTKIANQINWVARQMHGKDWRFEVMDWRETLAEAAAEDFVYLDPPYVGRHTDYFNSWTDDDATRLAVQTRDLPCGFALSMWLENRYRRNDHLVTHWHGLEMRQFRHFYHVGATEDLRNEMTEALVIKPGFAAAQIEPPDAAPIVKRQLSFSDLLAPLEA